MIIAERQVAETDTRVKRVVQTAHQKNFISEPNFGYSWCENVYKLNQLIRFAFQCKHVY